MRVMTVVVIEQIARREVRVVPLRGKPSTVVLQRQQPANAVLAALDHVAPAARVIMDGVTEGEQTRTRLLAPAPDAPAGDRG
jgi:hypothetical protein